MSLTKIAFPKGITYKFRELQVSEAFTTLGTIDTSISSDKEELPAPKIMKDFFIFYIKFLLHNKTRD